jgi:hypothetical protein
MVRPTSIHFSSFLCLENRTILHRFNYLFKDRRFAKQLNKDRTLRKLVEQLEGETGGSNVRE